MPNHVAILNLEAKAVHAVLLPFQGTNPKAQHLLEAVVVSKYSALSVSLQVQHADSAAARRRGPLWQPRPRRGIRWTGQWHHQHVTLHICLSFLVLKSDLERAPAPVACPAGSNNRWPTLRFCCS